MLIKLLLIYLVIINLITFIIFGADKRAAIKGKQRIREAILLLFAFIGGSVGALFAMKLFRHKTRKPKLTVAIPLMLFVQVAVICYLLNLFGYF